MPLGTPDRHIARLGRSHDSRPRCEHLDIARRVLEVGKTVGLDTARLEKDMADPAVLESIKQSNGLADRLHFDGTPTFVINDRIIVGELTDAQLKALTDLAAKS